MSLCPDLPKLVWLRLSGNPIADVVLLGRLTAMRWLMLDAGTSEALVGNHRPLLLIETGDHGERGLSAD